MDIQQIYTDILTDTYRHRFISAGGGVARRENEQS